MVNYPNITIVIVNYNGYEYTSQCIDSIYQHQPKLSFEIVVVDNASTDNSADMLVTQYPEIRLVRSKENRGIAGGNNLGIQAGIGRFVLLLNNDTEVQPGAIDKVAEFLEQNPEAGGVGGNLINPDGTFQSGACPFPSLVEEFLNITKLGLLLWKYYPSYPPFSEKRTVDWMSTAFMLFRQNALEEVGLVDEEFFIYSDETDLEYRLWEAGWKIYYLPEVNTIHYGGKSLEPWWSRKLKYRGRLLFFRKHRSHVDEAFIRFMYIISSSIKIVFWSVIFLMPKLRKRANQEINSQYDILKLSINPSLPPVIQYK